MMRYNMKQYNLKFDLHKFYKSPTIAYDTFLQLKTGFSTT